MGILEYLSQTCHNLDFIKEDDLKYKYIDDATICEYIALKEVGLSSYNVRHHVPSDVPVDGVWIPADNLQSQCFMNTINDWTESMIDRLERNDPGPEHPEPAEVA